MTYRDILLPLLSYPTPAPHSALVSGARLARRLGGTVTAVAAGIQIKPMRNRLANLMAGIDELVAEENTRNLAVCETLGRDWLAVAAEEGVETQLLRQISELYGEQEAITVLARSRDLSLISVGPVVEADQPVAEAVLFGAGRPVIIYPEAVEIAPAERFSRVVVGWDGGRAAARALADGLPILREAGEVSVLTVTGEKALAKGAGASEVVRHLSAHGVRAEVVERPLGSSRAGDIVDGYAREVGADLLIIGAFGHSRAREFILGGVTQQLLRAPAYPVLLSH